MTKIQAMIYAVFLCLEVIGIAALIELYKKQIRKDKAKKLEIYVIAEVLSALAVVILAVLNIFKPILGLIGAPIWADYILYNVGIFALQMIADMKMIKKLAKSCAKSLLLSYGLTEQQIADLLGSIENAQK